MKKLDNRGFTLVELIAVIVILIIVTAVAVPNVSSTVEKAKAKKDEEASNSLKYAVELYLSDNKSYRTNFYNGNCYMNINDLIKERYIMKDEIINDYQYVIYNNSKIISTNSNSGKVKC